MFNFLDKKVEPQGGPTVITKTQNEIIQEIHNDFDSAQENLLKQAYEIIESNKIPEEERIRAEKLRRLGFGQVKDVVRLNENDLKTATSKQTAENIVYYKTQYPFLKFLTITELDRICKKYGLAYSSVGNYIGDVPEKNLQDICNAQELNVKDYKSMGSPGCFKHKETGEQKRFYYESPIYQEPRPIGADNVNDWEWGAQDTDHWSYPYPASNPTLQIAAPLSMFNTQNLKQVGHALVDKDPIVFRFVRGGIQVITKWGLEASDPSLINPIDN